jgi:hypothetical protein
MLVSFVEKVEAQTISVTSVSPNPVCAGSNVTITFTTTNGISNQYDNNTVYTIYLSNSVGASFTSQGTFNTTGISYTSGDGGITTAITTTFTIPAGTTSGAGYKISLGSANPTFDGSTGTGASPSFTINALPDNTSFTFSGANDQVCSGSSGIFTFDAINSSFVAPYTITYQILSGAIVVGTGSATIPSASLKDITVNDVPTTPGTYIYTLTSITNGNDCVTTSGFGDATAQITVLGLPNNISTGFTGNSFCVTGGQGTLTFDADNTYFTSGSIQYTDGTTTWTQIIPNNDPYTFNVAVNPSSAGNHDYYLVSITNQNNCTTTSGFGDDNARITINQQPTTPDAGVDQSNCNNGSFTLAGNNPSIGNGLWSVISGTATITAKTSPNSIVTGIPAGSSATLIWTITNGTCVLTDEVILTNNALPTVSLASQTNVLCFGASTGAINITAADGTAPYTYAWTGSGVIPTAEDQNGLAAGNYSVIVTDANGCSSASLPVTITQPGAALTKTSISNSPICSGSTINLSASASGGTSPYTYNWTGPNGFIINNNPTPFINNATTLNSGTYTVTVIDANGCSASSTTNVTVYPTLNPGSIGSAQTICYNTLPASLTETTVATGGTGSYTYQWESSPDNSIWTPIGGATSSTYSPGNLTASTYFRRVVTSTPCGPVYTASILITVQPLLAAGTIATDQTICYNSTPNNLTSTSNGGNGAAQGTQVYLWEISTDGGAIWNVIPGATSAGYNFTAPLTQTTLYRRSSGYFFNSVYCYSLPTSAVTITVQNNVNPGTISADQTICEGGDPALLSSLTDPSGGSTLTYQWQISTTSAVAGFSDISGATSLTYDPPGPVSVNTWYRRVTISTLSGNVCSSYFSNAVSITINKFTSAGEIAADQVLCLGDIPAAFTSTSPASSNGVITYQWQSSPDNITFNDISGATGLTYTPATPAANTWYRRLAISTLNGVSCQQSSNTVEILLGTFNAGTISPVSGSYCGSGDPGTITGTPVSVSPPSNLQGYQWQISTDNIIWTDIAGATGQNYDPTAISFTTYYRRLAIVKTKGSFCSAPSNVSTWNVYPVPTLTVTSTSPVCEGSSITVTATASNTSGTPNYTLTYVSGTYITPPTAETNTTGIFTITTPPAGIQNFNVSVTNGDVGACSATQLITVVINDVPDATLIASCSSGANDGTITMTGTVTYPAGSVAEYSLNGGAWQTNPLFSNLAPGTYTVIIRNSLATSCTTQLTGQVVSKTVETTDFSVCQNGTVSAGQGLTGASLCITYKKATSVFTNTCVDASSPTYVASGSATAPYTTGATVWYAVLGTIVAPNGSMNIKDCPDAANTSWSIYQYPFNPSSPATNFIRKIDNTCPGGAEVNVTGLNPNIPYVIVLNSTNTSGCSNVQFTTGDNIQAGSAFGPVNWYENATTSTILYTGDIFNPLTVPGSGITNTSTPGTWTFYAGCSLGACREPATFTINPIPTGIPVATNICSGTTTSIDLLSNNSLGNPITPASSVTYTWTASVISGSASGFSDCTSGCGTTIAQTLTNNSSGCATVRYVVTPSVNGCPGLPFNVDVNVINTGSIVLPTPPLNATYSCLSQVPAALLLTATHPCLTDNTVSAVETNNGGTGCAGSPIIITRTWTFTYACGSSSVSQTITVVDNTAPTFTKPADITIFTDATCGYTANPIFTGDVTDEADDCTTSGLNATYSDVVTAGPCQGSQIITRTWSLTDNCLNTNTQVQTITVSDNTAPAFTRPADITIYTDASCNYNTTPAVTGDVTNESDNCSTGLNATYTDVVANGPCEGSKTITRTWHLADNCNNAAADQVQTITVNDNTAPTFTKPADMTINTDANCNYNADPSITGDVTNEADNCSTGLQATYTDVVANGICEGSKIVTRTWHLIDNCGNAAADQIQIITVTDNSPPGFTRPADITIYRDANCNYDASLIYTGDVSNVQDNCSTGITATFTDNITAGVCNTIITRTWSLTDKCGNTTTQVQTITVNDNTLPVITCPAAQTFCEVAGNNYTIPVLVATDNCSAAPTITYDITGATIRNDTGTNASGTFNVGVSTITWTVTDACGNISTCTTTITIQPKPAPKLISHN